MKAGLSFFPLSELEPFDQFIRASFSAFFFGVDNLDDVFHFILAEECARFIDAAEEGKASCLFGILCQNDDLIKQIDNTVRCMCDDDYDLSAVRAEVEVAFAVEGTGDFNLLTA